MSSLPAEAMPVVGRYELVREIGRGGMAVVHLARQTDLDRDVALKELRLLHAADPMPARRFLQESRVGAALTHPSVVTVYDYFERDGTPYIAMEYLERGSLRPWIGHTSLAENVGVLESLLTGLDYAARCDVVHRDIKPENLLVTTEGRIKIADFGIVKASNRFQRSAFPTRSGTPVGTPRYMAPEQAKGEELGPWTDLYSVGVVAWELFVGRAPFHDTDAAVAILLRHINEDIPSAHTVEPSVDPAISAWIDRLLVKDPRDRAQSAADAWDELEQIVSGLLDSCWRRDARLPDRTDAASKPAGATVTDAEVIELPVAPAPAEAVAVAPPPAPPAEAVAVAPPPPPPPPPAPPFIPALAPRPASPRRRIVAAAALAAVAAAVAGLLAGGLGDRGAPLAQAGTPVQTSGLRLTAPAGWAPLHRSLRVRGLGVSDMRLLGPDHTGQTGVEAGVANYASPSLLSREAAAAIEGDVPAPVAVRLGGGIQAYRYDRLRWADRPGLVTIYAVPTTDWVVTLACFAPATRPERLDAMCATVAGTLRPTASEPIGVGPGGAFAGGIARALARLGSATAAAQIALDGATTPAGQADAAGRLAAAYERAAGELQVVRGSVVDGLASNDVRTGVTAAAAAYRRLAAAALDGSPAAYDVARGEVTAARERLTAARQALARAGYEVR